jgi:branched-chain amino acid transport system substrate-binding protein
MRTKTIFCLVLSVVLLNAFGFGAMAASPAPQAIPIGGLVSLTGFDSNLGGQAKAGYEIAVDDINRAGGVFVKEYGKKLPLELTVQDMESDVMKVPGRMEWLYTSKKVVVYVGTTMMATTGTGVSEKNKITALAVASPRQIQHERGLKYWISPFGKTPDTARIIFDVLDSIPADKKPKTIAIFEEQADFGIEQAEAFRKEALRRGYKIAVSERYPQMAKDMSPMIMAAKNAGAELVLSNPVTPDAMLMVRQMKELDYNPKAFVLIRGAGDLSWSKAMGALGDYVFANDYWHNRVKYPGVDKLNAAYQARFGRPADTVTGPAYASVQIVAAAIENAGTLDTTKIRDAIASTDMMTVMGKIKFRANGTLIDPCSATYQWLGGSQKLIWPAEFRETAFAYPIPPWKDR